MHPATDAAIVAAVLLAGAGHAVVIRRDWFPQLCRPLDAGRAPDGVRLLGDHKTWRGVVVMVVATTATGAVLLPLAPEGPAGPAGGALVGAAFGLAYVLAELPNSFAKRRLGIAPGEEGRGRGTQYLVDQADSVVGVALAAWWLLPLGPGDVVVLVLTGVALHVAVDRLLHRTGVKGRPARPPTAPTG